MSVTATGLLEREVELAALEAAVAALRSGRGGSLVLLGPAGIGKTQLMRAAIEDARDAGIAVVLARASEFERGFAFGVVRQLFEPLVSSVSAQERDALFVGAAALARETFQPAAAADDAPKRETTYATLHALYWLCVNLADRGPLVLAVDDLQWADGASLRWISFLARRLDGLPVLLLATLRTDGPPAGESPADDLVVNRLARTVRPTALSLEATEVVVRHALGEEPAPEFVLACHGATRGNPLFLHELLGSLRERAVRPTATAASRIEEVGPQAVTRLVLHRLAGLGPDAERVAQAAALAGDGADRELVREIADLDHGAFADAAHRLSRADLVTVEPLVTFVHPVSRAAIVASLEPQQRASLSRRAATLLAERDDLEGVAGHLLAVPPAADATVVSTLRRAAGRALARGAPEAAMTLLQRALLEPPPPGEEAKVLHELGTAELRLRAAVAPVHLRAALDLTEPGLAAARIADDLARALHSLNRSSEAVAVAEAALEGLDAAPAEARDRLAARLVELARFVPDRVDVHRRVAAHAEAISDPAMLARVGAIRAYDAMLAVVPAAQVAEDARNALRAGALATDNADGSMPVFLATMALAAAGDHEGAGLEIEHALDTARRRGSVVSYTGALSIRARLRLQRGDLRGVEADAREIEELGDEGLGRDYVASWLVESLVGQGRFAEAEKAVTSGVLAGEAPARIVFNPGLHARGQLRIAQGRLEDGLADVLECGRRQEGVGAHNPADVPWRATAALALHALGRQAEALALSEEELELARRFGAPAVLGAAETVRGVVVGGKAGLGLLEDAVARLEPTPARRERSRALLAAGIARLATGDVAGARRALQPARELAEACGAVPLAAEAVEAMVAAGGRPRRTRTHGAAALTPSERRTAEQAARGLSNRDIAQLLFVTEKTVESHLSNAYRKLGIASRSQLAAGMAPRPLEPDDERRPA